MATVVNRADPSIFRVSANTPDYPADEWLINPPGFLALFDAVPSRYWKLTAGGDDIEEMTQAEKDAVDAAQAAAIVATAKSAAKALQDGLDETGRALRATVKLTVDELNALRQWCMALQSDCQAADNWAAAKPIIAALPPLSDRTYLQAKSGIDAQIDGE